MNSGCFRSQRGSRACKNDGVTRSSADGLGVVKTQYATVFTQSQPLELAGGTQLPEVEVAYETYGTLNAQRSNAIYICHALTGDAHAAGYHVGDTRPGWWDNMIGPGKPIDTDRWFVVASNILGGCQGTTGPSSTDPRTGRPYELNFPLLDMADFVSVHRALARHLGIERFAAVVGGSLGGMQVLQWSLTHPEEMGRALIFAASSRLTAQNIAFSAVGRQAIMRDPDFNDGQFISRKTFPGKGLSVARMMAHITYLSEEAFQEKFGRSPQEGVLSPHFGVDFAVESYLEHQGQRFLSRFDPLSYLYLTRAMDYFDPFSRDGALDRIVSSPVKFLIMSFDTDWRFATSHSRRIVRHLEGARIPTSFREISSPWGHDSFLLEIEQYHASVEAFLARAAQEEL